MNPSGQFQTPQTGGDAQLDAHIAGLRSRRDDQAQRALNEGQTFTQSQPRSGIAPIHIHNYVNGTRRGAQQMQQRQQQMQQQQQQQQRRNGREQVVRQQQQFDDDPNFDAVDEYLDDAANGGVEYYNEVGVDDDDFQEPVAPPPRRRTAPQQQQQRQRQPQQQQRMFAADELDDSLPPPPPDVARKGKMAPRNFKKPETLPDEALKQADKQARARFLAAGGKLDESDIANAEEDEFEMFKQYQAMKSGQKQQPQAKGKRKQDAPPKRQAQQQQRHATDDNMVLDVDAEDQQQDDGGDDDNLESAEAKLRRENAALRAKLAAQNASKTNDRIASIKKNMNKQPQQVSNDDDGDAFDEDEQTTYDNGDEGDDDSKLGAQVEELKKLLAVDKSGKSAKQDEFNTKIDDITEMRTKLTDLKHKLVDIGQDPSKKARADKLSKEKKDLEKTLLNSWNELIAGVREFQSSANRVHGRTTDQRQLEFYSELMKKNGIPTERDLKMLGSQIVSVTASANDSHSTLTRTLERFNRERVERDKLAFTAKEQARLLGQHSDSAAASRFVSGADAVGRSGANRSNQSSSTGAFFVPSASRPAVGAYGSYAGYDPVTRLPANKAVSEFSVAETVGVPWTAVDANKEAKANTQMSQAFRQKKPNMNAGTVPKDSHVGVRRGLFRTGNTELIQAVSASRADSGDKLYAQDFRRITRDLPRGATFSKDGQFAVLPGPFDNEDAKTGGQ